MPCSLPNGRWVFSGTRSGLSPPKMTLLLPPRLELNGNPFDFCLTRHCSETRHFASVLSGRTPALVMSRARRGLLARALAAAFDLIHHLREVVARRGLQRRKRLERLEPLEPQLLADGQHVPVVQEGRRRSAQRASHGHSALRIETNSLLERVAPHVLHQREMERDERQNPTLCPWL